MKNRNFLIESLTAQDLDAAVRLQPEGWPDILSAVRFYVSSGFCFPLKATIDGQLAGIGTAIVYGKTAWLAHIIVHHDHRNVGIGTSITHALIELIHKMNCQSISLLATSLGEPVYKKLGFKVETQYSFFERETPGERLFSSTEIRALEPRDETMLLQLDREVSGEHREQLLLGHLNGAQIFVGNNTLKGYYLPSLGEGLIIAATPEAGLALMQLRSASVQKFCIPIENECARIFLRESGYSLNRMASRMVMGSGISWQGNKIYSRIGGNMG